MRRTLGQIRAILNETGPAGSVGSQVSRRAQAGVYIARLSVRILKQWARDRCPQQAAALAFQTALSMVPILAIAFALLRTMGSGDSEVKLLDYLSTHVLPDLGGLTEYLQTFSAKISIGGLGGLSLFFTLATCFSLYTSVEKIFNDIWRVDSRRTIVGKFLTFYALVTLLPVLATASIYWSGRLIGSGHAAQFFGPLLLQGVALFLVNKLLPATYVRWQSAFVGMVVSSFALEGLKVGFLKFAKRMLLQTYEGVYGPLGLVPMVLVWIYISWLIVLLGAEISNAVQNLRVLEAEDRRQTGQEPINGLVATQLLAVVAAEYERGGSGISREDLATEFGVTADVVARVVARLKEKGLIAEVQGDRQGLIPGRASNTITMTDILGAFRATDLETAKGTTSPTLAKLIAGIEEARRTHIDGVTLSDLLPGLPNDRPPMESEAKKAAVPLRAG